MKNYLKTNCLTLIPVFGLLTGLTACHQQIKEASPSPTATATAGPRIQFAAARFDFGKVNAGAIVKHDFIFTNIGGATLEILEVKPGCGCTTTANWDRKVKPGKTGIIPIEFNSAPVDGAVMKAVTITCNDPGQSNVVLQISGTVWRPINVSATMVGFNVSSESAPAETRVVQIVSNMDEPLKLFDPQCTNSAFRAELKTVKEGKEFELRISAALPSASSSPIVAPVTVRTSAAEMPTIEVTAFLMVQQLVTVIPEQIRLFSAPLTSPAHQAVTVRYIGTNSFVLSDAAVNVPGIVVGMRETEPERAFTLEVEFEAGFKVEPEQKLEITVKSNHPKYPVIKIPVFGPQISPTAEAGK